MRTNWLKLILLVLMVSLGMAQFQMTIRTSDGTLHTYAIADIEQLTFEGVLDVEDAREFTALLNNFRLLQNYPNPFNPTTTIEYQLSEAGSGSISIYNMLGQVVTEYEFQHGSAGSYTYMWNGVDRLGRPVASGLYVYQLKFAGGQETKQLLLLR